MRAMDTLVHSSSLILNSILLVLVQKATSRRYRDYRNVVRLTCVNDMVVSVAFLLCHPVGLHAAIY